MAKFIDVMGENGNWEFVCLEQIVKVTCNVETQTLPSGPDLRSLTNPSISPNLPPDEVHFVTIRMFTAIGESKMLFAAKVDADAWADYNLGISDIVGRSDPDSD